MLLQGGKKPQLKSEAGVEREINSPPPIRQVSNMRQGTHSRPRKVKAESQKSSNRYTHSLQTSPERKGKNKNQGPGERKYDSKSRSPIPRHGQSPYQYKTRFIVFPPYIPIHVGGRHSHSTSLGETDPHDNTGKKEKKRKEKLRLNTEYGVQCYGFYQRGRVGESTVHLSQGGGRRGAVDTILKQKRRNPIITDDSLTARQVEYQ